MAILDFDDKKMNSESDSINEDEVISSFGELIRRSEKQRTNQNLRSIISKVEENIQDNEKYIIKMFLLNNKTGIMINSDNSPNISFRVDTINNSFDSIVDSVRSAGLSQEQVDKIFFTAGHKCGKAFGSTFINYLDMYYDAQDDEDRLKEWCLFDSSVGWGKLSYDPAEKAVIISNSFQAKKIDTTGTYPQDCHFFKGYIAGVLSGILGNNKEIKVSCDGCETCPKKSGGKDCVMKIAY